MTLKLNLQALEHNFSFDEYEIPAFLSEEIRKFAQRNILVTLDANKESGLKEICCIRCLKAHLAKKMKERGSSTKIIEKIGFLKREQPGHDGYYLDGQELIKI